LKALTEQGVVVPLRSQQKDAGRALSHRVQAVELYLQRHTFTQIRQRIRHSLVSIANGACPEPVEGWSALPWSLPTPAMVMP
jgi:hypothetical protein